MLSNISWTTFLTTLFVAAILYYGVIGTIYFPKEILAILLGKRNRQPAPIGPTDQIPDQREFTNLMGISKDDSSHELTTLRSILDQDVDTKEGQTPVPDITLIAGISDLMEAIRTLLRVIKDQEGGIEEVKSLFPSLLSGYTQVAQSKYRYAINTYVHDMCTNEYNYAISVKEVDSFWPTTDNQSI